MKQFALFAMLFASPTLMMGSALTGTLTLNGSSGQNVAVGPCAGAAFCIDFDWTGTTNPGPPTTVATGTVDGTGDGALFDITNNFATSNGGTSTQVTIGDLNSTSEPINTTVSDANFVTFNHDPWNITLTEVIGGVDGAGACGAAATSGQICTPGGTPFNEQNEFCASSTSCEVVISFQFDGTAFNGSSQSSVSGIFSTTFSGTTFQAINEAIAGGADVVTSDSSTLIITPLTGVPEPMTSALIGTGLLGLGLLGRKRRQI
jgi:hypothetical protein